MSGTTLVTGGAGFIGSHLVRRLAAGGARVRVLDSFDAYYDPHQKWLNLRDLIEADAVDLAVGDIRDRAVTERALAAKSGWPAVDRIVHLAARAGVRPSLEQPGLYADVNVTGTVKVLEAARAHDVRNVVIASSSSVYGDSRSVPFREEESEGAPVSPYGASKLAMEIVSRTLAQAFDLKVTALRFFTAYGPRQRPDMAIHKFARLIEAGEPLPMFGRGDTQRDYTYVDDVVDGIVLSFDRPGTGFRVYNLGREETVSLSQLVESLEQALGRRAVRQELPEQAGDVRVTAADCSRARSEFGYRARVSLEDGLREFVRWLRA